MAIQGQSKGNVVDKVNSVREKVEHVLQADRSLADNDERLVSTIWHLELVKLQRIPEKMTALDFFDVYAKGQLTSADVITRARRKVEEDMPHLRGTTWEERQGMKQETRNRINQPTVRASRGSKKQGNNI